MTKQNWADPTRPGVPLFPERDGWHWLSNTPNQPPFPAEWTHQKYSENKTKWFWVIGEEWEEDYEMAECYYYGPCLFPAQINEMLAAERAKERERIIAALDNSTKAAADDFTPMQYGALMAITQDIIEGIRALGGAA